MAGERSYVQVPPDSTGKKIRHNPYLRISFTGNTGGHVWREGSNEYTITGSVSLSVTVFKGLNGETGRVGIKLKQSDILDNAALPIQGDIIRYQGTQVAVVGSEQDLLYLPYSNIAGGNSPDNLMDVDNTGSANIRFSEGRPQLDAFGRLRVSTGSTLGDYIFASDIQPNNFSSRIVGNATEAWDANLHALKITCASGTPAAGTIDSTLAENTLAKTTNTYHHYYPGFSQMAIMTVALGDAGRDGVTRNWGYFDENNGYMFRCDDASSGLKLVIRSKATGTVQETVITADNFNGDKVDGTGSSQMDLRLTDDNIYWVDVQWLGAGRVRFGTYHRGERIVIHEHYHEGSLNAGKPSSQTGSLPICFVQKQTTFQSTDSNMFVWCAAVHTEHQIDIATQGRNRLETITKTFDPASLENGQEYELIGVLTPVQTISNKTNRSLYLPNYMEAMAYHADGTAALVEIEVYANPVIGGGNMSFPINSNETANTPWLVPVSLTDRTNIVEVYKPENYTLADRPKLWGGGLHVLASYGRGEIQQDVSNLYSDFQNGAFKNFSENGGTEDHATASWSVGTTTEFTSAMPMLIHREGNPVKFYGIDGTLGPELNYDSVRDNQYYMRITGINTAELYEDIEFTTAVDTTGLTYTTPGRMNADYGLQMYFVAVCKPLAPTVAAANTAGDVTVHFNLGWSEVQQ